MNERERVIERERERTRVSSPVLRKSGLLKDFIILNKTTCGCSSK